VGCYGLLGVAIVALVDFECRATSGTSNAVPPPLQESTRALNGGDAEAPDVAPAHIKPVNAAGVHCMFRYDARRSIVSNLVLNWSYWLVGIGLLTCKGGGPPCSSSDGRARPLRPAQTMAQSLCWAGGYSR
jgi:hypothetical protein